MTSLHRKRIPCCVLAVFIVMTTTGGASAFLPPSSPSSIHVGVVDSISRRKMDSGYNCQKLQLLPLVKIMSDSCLYSSTENENEEKTTTTEEALSTSSSPPPAPPQPTKSTSKTSSPPINTNSPSAIDMMNAMGTSPRRIFLSLLSSTSIALVANLFGVTSALLTSVPEDLVEQTGLDGYYPRGGFKRYRGAEYGYTVLLPKEWVADTAVELAKVQRRTKMLDYSMSKKGGGVIPDAAFGPPSRFNDKGVSQSDTNLSIVASTLPPSSSNGKPTLQTMLGTPQNAAETLLRFSIAPAGSGRIATLLAACEETRGSSPSNVYQFEYDIEKEGGGENDAKTAPRRAISVIAIRDSTLITMTVVAPRKDWLDKSFDTKLRRVAESFKLTR